jgi:TRAP-type C4-dicarboxylate transport system substrate-binding protein
MRLVRLNVLACALGLAALLLAGVLPAPLAGPQSAWGATTLKAQFFLPAGHPLSKRLAQIFGEMEQATGGDVKVQPFFASQLVPLPQALDALSKGTLDILVGPGAYYSGKIAIADFGIMPLNFKSDTDRSRAWYDEGLGEIVDKAFNRLNVKVVAPYNYFTGEVVLVRKGVTVNGYDDLKGLKLRVAGGELVELTKAMGAQPVFIPPPEMYVGFQRGTVDGAIFPSNDLVLLKLHEVVGTVVLPDYLFSGPMMHFFKFNMDTWNRLSAKDRAAISKVLKEAALRDERATEEELVKPFRAQAEAAGVKYITLSGADIAKAKVADKAARDAYLKYNREQGHGAEAERILQILDRLSGL